MQAQHALELFLAADTSGRGELARQSLLRLAHWPLSVAFSSWRQAAADQAEHKAKMAKALQFMYFDATLKVGWLLTYTEMDCHNRSCSQPWLGAYHTLCCRL